MNKKRRTFTSEFKQQAVELALVNGDIIQTARDLGVDQSNLRKWIRAFEAPNGAPFPGSGNPRDKELAELKKKLYNLEQENAILKKAVGIFAPRSR
ncbi:MAG TPA: transposase [Fodinibius sp.]|nr:transposase [Fodinibius sp.]